MIVDVGVVVAFALLWAAVVPTPGANSLMVTHVALTRNRRHVACAVAGNMLGILALGLAALLGLAAVLEAFPWLRRAIGVAARDRGARQPLPHRAGGGHTLRLPVP